ncbi:hypothetical protein OSB04_012042 [Centaurea solstitialis]|uniref:GAG-pre-integrase domain-containing protein n=1 Tax=Centaurea solstitialis TaxID=347529 RepID=A0AA38TAN8_9ASTR|nr:hypothetical protein OSB04_012042 [Centaurea solstitialis]
MGYGDILHDKITINKVAYVEGLSHNLLNIGQFCDKGLGGYQVQSVRTLEGKELMGGSRKTNYTINFKSIHPTLETCLLTKAFLNQNILWHRRLSHLNYATINQLAKSGLVTSLPSLKFTKEQCALPLLHMDLCGPMSVQSISGRKYVLVIVDDH